MLLSLLGVFGDDLQTLAARHGVWMFWNLVLAWTPAVLAALLFRTRRRHGAAWWMGLVLFVVFLPNAPYVITDVIHLLDDIRVARSDLQILGLYLPVYTAFFAIGFGSYVLCLEAAKRHANHHGQAHRWPYIEVTLHVLCAIGIYLGRVLRLNSWEVFTRPKTVLGSVDWLVGPMSVVLVSTTFVVLIAGTLIARAVMYACLRRARSLAALRRVVA